MLYIERKREGEGGINRKKEGETEERRERERDTIGSYRQEDNLRQNIII